MLQPKDTISLCIFFNFLSRNQAGAAAGFRHANATAQTSMNRRMAPRAIRLGTIRAVTTKKAPQIRYLRGLAKKNGAG